MYRYIPNTREDQEKMLSAIGAGVWLELFSDIPEDIRWTGTWTCRMRCMSRTGFPYEGHCLGERQYR